MIELAACTRLFLALRHGDIVPHCPQSPDHLELCEAESEAQLAARTIWNWRGRPLDFRDAADQDTIPARLYAELGVAVHRARKRDRSLHDEDHTAFERRRFEMIRRG